MNSSPFVLSGYSQWKKSLHLFIVCIFIYLFTYLLCECVYVWNDFILLFSFSISGYPCEGGQRTPLRSFLPPCYGFWGLDSGCQACVSSTFICWAISLAPTGPTLLSGKLYYPQHLEHCLPLSSVQEILVKQGVVVQTSNPSTGELEAGGSGV